MYEYATGLHPFDAQTQLALAARVLEREPQPIRALRPDVPDEVAVVIERALRKTPADRFASAAEMVSALKRAPDVKVSSGVTGWWRNHQLAVLGLYFVASALAWQIKEWQHGLADGGFVVIAVAATIAGVFRGHLLFTERMNRSSFEGEHRRAQPVTLIVDVLIGVVLASEGLWLAFARPLAGVLTIALAVGIVLSRLVVEPATTRGAFGIKN
jgi:hypothetical protein